jgi:hypothetical protein
MIYLRNISLIVLLLLAIPLQAAKSKIEDTEAKLKKISAVYINGELVPYIQLSEVTVFAPLKFKNKKQEKFYWKTVRDVKKTLPYAKTAGKIMREMDAYLLTIPEKEHKAYIKIKEKELFSQFEGELKAMTISQGQMLIRLIDRECDRTTYQIIKFYKSGFAAAFWQGIARLFGSNLKAQYDVDNADNIIERVIVLVEEGQL